MQFIEGYDTNVSIVSLAAHILYCVYSITIITNTTILYVQNMMTIDGKHIIYFACCYVTNYFGRD